MHAPVEHSILLIDDSAEDRATWQRYLCVDQQLRYHIHEAETGRQGLALWRSLKPDCVLIAAQLPDVSGLEIIEMAAQEPALRHTAMVMLTASGSPGTAVQALRSGASDCLDKAAVSPEQLRQALQHALEKATLRRQLEEERERYRALTEASSVAVWTIDESGPDEKDWAMWEQLTGQSLEEARVSSWLSKIHPKDRKMLLAAFAAPDAKDAPFKVEFRILHRSGEYRYYVLRCVPLKNAMGDFREWVSSLSDIDDRKQAERQLLENQHFIQSLLNTAPVAIFLKDLQTRKLVYLSTRVEEMLGYSSQELETMGAARRELLLHPEDRAVYRAYFARLQQADDEALLEVQYRVQHKHGYWLYLQRCDKVFERLPNGAPKTVIGAVLDITRNKQIEQQLEKSLVHAQQARAEAEAANRAKDEFLAVVSHELRAPLNAMLGWARILSQQSPPAPKTLDKAIEVISRNASVQRRLIEDLLDASRLATGKLKLDLRTVELATVAQAALDVVRATAEAKMISLQAVFDPELRPITGDADRLQQVIWNLLSNAIKFTPEGGRVELLLEQAYDHARVIVRDTGKGIAPEFLPFVFEQFRQADSSSTRRQGGLGLGLTLVKHLVEAHGGGIQIESEGEGHGTTVTVELPLQLVQIETHSPISAPLAQFAAQALNNTAFDELPSLAGAAVLVVADEDETREVIRLILERCGAHVVTVATSNAAFELLADDTQMAPDLLICDLALPQEDGDSFIRKVRAWETARGLNPAEGLPVVAVIVQARTEERLRALTAGFQMHIAKPVEPAELVLVAASLLNKSLPTNLQSA